MRPRDGRNWKPGDLVKLTRPIKARYSGYAGRPEFTAPAGCVAIVRSGPHPAVTGRERDFYVATVPDWDEGVPLWTGDARKV